MSQYPKDEFDRAAEERGPKGVHRRPESTLARFLPYIAVLILGPLLAWGVVSFLNRDSDDGAPPETPIATEAPEETDAPDDDSESPDGDEGDEGENGAEEPDGEADGDATEPAEEPTDDALDVRYDSAVSVLNGTQLSGLAGTVADQVTGDGFTDVFSGNYQSALPDVSYVYYQTDELADTAQHIADLLGISSTEVLATASNEIVVVLRADFDG